MKIATSLRDWYIFMLQSLEIRNIFITLLLKQFLWKTKTFFENIEYGFFVEHTTIENAIFPFKTALTKATVKTNSMKNIKSTYHKEGNFVTKFGHGVFLKT